MERLASFLIVFFLFGEAACAQAQSNFYVFSGNSLEIRYGNPVASYTRWQVWLFQEGVHLPRYTAGLQYSRWGLIEGTSATSVMQRLRAFQNFEEAYLNFFGPQSLSRRFHTMTSDTSILFRRCRSPIPCGSFAFTRPAIRLHKKLIVPRAGPPGPSFRQST